jgi:hypothetical protein
MLKKPPDELFGGEGGEADTVGGPLLVFESDVAVFEADNAIVGEGDAKDIGGEILECGLAGTDFFKVSDPLLAPNTSGDLVQKTGFVKFGADLGAEDDAERFAWKKEAIFARAPAAVGVETASGDNVVDVGVISEIAGPSV